MVWGQGALQEGALQEGPLQDETLEPHCCRVGSIREVPARLQLRWHTAVNTEGAAHGKRGLDGTCEVCPGAGVCACGFGEGVGGKERSLPQLGVTSALCFLWEVSGSTAQTIHSFLNFTWSTSPEFKVQLFPLVMESDFQLVKT